MQSRITPRRKTKRKSTFRKMAQWPYLQNKANSSLIECTRSSHLGTQKGKCSRQKAGALFLGKCLLLLTMQLKFEYHKICLVLLLLVSSV